MSICFFATDLHGRRSRYEKLLRVVEERGPDALFLGGDLLPMPWSAPQEAIDHAEIIDALRSLKGTDGPEVFLILGNDDPRAVEAQFMAAADEGVFKYLHMRRENWGSFRVYGYSCVPPTPFLLKDWERYDVSRYVDPGCISPEEGRRSVPVSERETRHRTIADDLRRLCGEDDLSRAILLFHTPPYQTALDRVALDGRMIDHVPLDVHVGSIAVKRLLEARQPRVTLHGHIHESTRLTGHWSERTGETVSFNAAHDGEELCLVTFDPDDPVAAVRELL